MKYFLVIFVFIALLITTTSMRQKMNYQLSNDDLSVESKILYKFIGKTGKIIGKKYNMSPCSIGGGIDDKIWLISSNFQCYNSYLNEEEARKLIINVIYDYLKLANEDNELRPYLKNYPIEPKNLDIVILNLGSDRKEIFDPYISIVGAMTGKICFYTNDTPTKYKSKKYETYEESLIILQKQEEKIKEK